VLSRNGVPFDFLDRTSGKGQAVLRDIGATAERGPVVVLFDGRVLDDPSASDVAAALGVRTTPEPRPYDVTVVGTGPAGLAAAGYGASEGLRTAVLEAEAIGGQAGTSSMIRNYLGFPRGSSGADLAHRAQEQARLSAPSSSADRAPWACARTAPAGSLRSATATRSPAVPSSSRPA
jgi:thioredoxin reductase (NADPH)